MDWLFRAWKAIDAHVMRRLQRKHRSHARVRQRLSQHTLQSENLGDSQSVNLTIILDS